MIRPCRRSDQPLIVDLINDAARDYLGVIPADCWHEPYFSADGLKREIAAGVRFWGSYGTAGELEGVMGIQDRGPVLLIRHAYVRPDRQRHGIGSALLERLSQRADRPLLVGTWADAVWAVGFYRRHGFRLLPAAESAAMLARYWRIPRRQAQASVVLRRDLPEDRRQ